MSAEFHYPTKVWSELKGMLPEEWLPLDEYLLAHRPKGMSDEDWEQADFYDDEGPKAIFVWVGSKKRTISHTSKRSGIHIAAADLFLEAMRTQIRASINHFKVGGYVTPGEMKRNLISYSKKISKLIGDINNLPLAVRRELSPVIDKQKQSQWIIKEAISGLPKNMPKKFIREIFLLEMFREYEAAYGEPPKHTYNRELGPDVGFHGVARKMCKWARQSPKGI
ncbi:MAG: hypothetical protein JRI99_14725, partial [Deltaproteobacteria bacterium]|nr:hypothetical protein [Deltaproteobacteria bacterium]